LGHPALDWITTGSRCSPDSIRSRPESFGKIPLPDSNSLSHETPTPTTTAAVPETTSAQFRNRPGGGRRDGSAAVPEPAQVRRREWDTVV